MKTTKFTYILLPLITTGALAHPGHEAGAAAGLSNGLLAALLTLALVGVYLAATRVRRGRIARRADG